MTTRPLSELMETLGYTFRNAFLLELALTHRSYANEHKFPQNNQRLEFLGDSVLGLVISDALYQRYPNAMEGELSKFKSRLICEGALHLLAKKLGLQKFVKMGNGEARYKGEERPGTLADAYEAIIAAIYLDGGFEPAREFILKNHSHWVEEPQGGWLTKDSKSMLQIRAQELPELGLLRYELIHSEGPDHARIFETAVWLGEHRLGTGKGRSKKESEQAAAEQALNHKLLQESPKTKE